MTSETLPRRRHLTVVRDPPRVEEPTPVEVLFDVALLGTRLWLWPFGYRLRVERRERPRPTWWYGE